MENLADISRFSRRHKPDPLWRQAASPEETAHIELMDARIAELDAERMKLTEARKLLSNRCAQRALARRRAN
jgi:hypothetical protein